jgi:hypothetical protein
MTPPSGNWSGPWLKAALLCQHVSVEGEHVLSLVRLVDRVVGSFAATAQGGDARLLINVKATAVLLLVRGDAPPGPLEVRMRCRHPSGALGEPLRATLDVPDAGPEHSLDVFVNLDMSTDEAGVHWFEFLVGDRPEPIARVPLTVERRFE